MSRVLNAYNYYSLICIGKYITTLNEMVSIVLLQWVDTKTLLQVFMCLISVSEMSVVDLC